MNYRKALRALAAAFATLAVATLAQAQPWPAKPIRMINTFSAGGSGDVLGRSIAAKMAETLGTPVIVESKPGAGGVIATSFVAKAPPDGYTILLTHLGSHAIVPALRKDVGYDPVKDFEAISQV